MNTIGNKLIMLSSVDSTNNYAVSLTNKETIENGTVIIADYQTSGRGNADNYWESEKDCNLTFSIILYPEFVPLSEQYMISKAISLGICDYLNLLIKDVTIKWPNDIYAGNNKIAGILIENFISGDKLLKTIAGIGININQTVFTSDAPNPISLKNITGLNYFLIDCLTNILKHIEKRYLQLKTTKGKKSISSNFVKSLYKFNEFAEYESKSKRFTAKITGVDNSGQLMMTDENNNKLVFGFKEVKLVAPKD